MDYFEPKTLSEALALLAKYGENAKVIAGGTDVLDDMKYKEEPECLINIKRIAGLGSIQENGGGVSIGPLVTIRELETNRLVRERLPLLWDSCHQFASLQIRNTATIGGNICRASPSGETLTPLLVLGAKAKLAFSDGDKLESFSSLFVGPGRTTLGFKGLLTEIEVPYPSEQSRGVYLKQAVRGAMDIAMVGVAVQITPGANATVQDVGIGLGAVAPTPVRATKAEAMVRGKPLTAAVVQEAAQMAAMESTPISDQRSSAEYRKWVVEALTRRGLEQSWKSATGKEVL
jgi:aerobic carbon-monoxide dehydrogenase medium subunit